MRAIAAIGRSYTGWYLTSSSRAALTSSRRRTGVL
jgi:hypothetical protein